MRSLWSHLDVAQTAAPFPGPIRNAALTAGFHTWLEERLRQDDAAEQLRAALPWATERQVADVVDAVCRVVRMP